jgi:hypothetical protein
MPNKEAVMIRSTIRPASARMLVLATLMTCTLAAPVAAIETGRPGPPPRDPPLDCTNRDNNICVECGQPDGILACCINGCDIIIGPQLPPPAPAPSKGFVPLRRGLGSMAYFSR